MARKCGGGPGLESVALDGLTGKRLSELCRYGPTSNVRRIPTSTTAG